MNPMQDDNAPQIRPIWLIGGSAAVVVLGACTLITLCAGAALIWFYTQTTTKDTPATQVIAQQATQPPFTLPPQTQQTQATPTLMPVLTSVQVQQATLFPVATSAAARPAPDQAVRAYYQLVSDQRYDITWNLLSAAFKQKFNCCAPNYNYGGYVEWWNSVGYVDFGAVSTVNISSERAVVYAELYYVMNTGARSGRDVEPYIELIFDAASGQWIFNDKRAAP